MNILTMTVKPTEGSMIDGLRSVQQSGKSVGLIDSSGGLGVIYSSGKLRIVDQSSGLGGVVSDSATFSSLTSDGGSFDDQVLMEDQDNRDYNAFVDTAYMASNLFFLQTKLSWLLMI